jgi:hypothetical protein
MINIHAEGKKLKVSISYKYPVSNWQTTFSIDESSELHSKLMAENLNNHLRETIEEIRRQEYEEGWKDAKSKKKKKIWFSQLMNKS